MPPIGRSKLSLVVIVMASLLAGLTSRVEAAKPLARYTAFAVDLSTQSSGARAGTVDIVINRWTTDQERRMLAAALKEGGPEMLLKALQKIKEPVGYIQTPGNVGYPLRFAQQIPTGDGGQRILIATDRPVSFFEAVNRPATSDYPFLLVDMRIDAKGEGQGKLLPLARVTSSDDHVVDIENYASEPVRLTSIRKTE